MFILGGLGVFARAASAIVISGLNDSSAYGDLIVVPGNTVAPDGTPVPRLQARLNAALRLYREGRGQRIFVSGGTGKEGFDEAVSMADYLVRHGVPSSAIIKDSHGRNGVAVTRTAHARYFEARDLYSIPREVVAYATYYAKPFLFAP